MNKLINYVLSLIFLFCISCNRSPNPLNNKESKDSLQSPSPINKKFRDTVSKPTDTLKENTNKITELKSVDDYIVNKKDKSSKAVKRSIEYEIEQWKHVTNPFVARYRGCDFGDYFHLNFEDSTKKNYDFGFGNNNYGKYLLFDSISFNDNRKYLGKAFKIYWDWKLTSFPCCDGDYHLTKAYLPSITKLELLETTFNKK